MIWILLAVAAMLLSGSLWAWRDYFDGYHQATVQDGVLYRNGIRSPGQFATALRRVRPKTVVSLVDEQEMLKEPFVSELSMCREKGIELVRIPIPLGGWPGEGQVKAFLDVVRDPARQPVLVHCAQGVRRTGMMVAAYQETVMKFDVARAKSALLSFGHSQRTVGDVQRFIDVYDPVQERMTAEFPMSEE
jgi:protein tyrosine phosphatase (PTP) superfamily phosphohydrolase (DUF442 family)